MLQERNKFITDILYVNLIELRPKAQRNPQSLDCKKCKRKLSCNVKEYSQYYHKIAHTIPIKSTSITKLILSIYNPSYKIDSISQEKAQSTKNRRIWSKLSNRKLLSIIQYSNDGGSSEQKLYRKAYDLRYIVLIQFYHEYNIMNEIFCKLYYQFKMNLIKIQQMIFCLKSHIRFFFCGVKGIVNNNIYSQNLLKCMQNPKIIEKVYQANQNDFLEVKKVLTNSHSGQQIQFSLKILFHLKERSPINISKEEFNLLKIQQAGSLKQKAYLLKIYQNQPNYLTYQQKFIQQFQKSQQEEQLQASFVILAIPEFNNKLPQHFCQTCIDKLTANIENMGDWQIYRALQSIFNTQFPSTKKFVQRATKNLLKKINEQNDENKRMPLIPLITKLLKIRDKLKMNNTQFQKYINENPLKFRTFFFKNSKDKGAFLDTIASKDSKRFLPFEFKEYFNNYIEKVFSDTIKAQQCDSDEIIQTVKLSLKYYNNFSPSKLTFMTKMLESSLIPMFEHEKQMAFWLLILLLRIDKNKIKEQKVYKILRTVLKSYKEAYSKSEKAFDKHLALQKIIELYYQMFRADCPIPNQKELLSFDFSHVRTFQQIIYACYIVINIKLSPSERFQLFEKMIPKIESYLVQGKVYSIKNYYTILSALGHSKCPQSKAHKGIGYLYKKLQTTFIKMIEKQKVCPSHKDLLFVKKVFIQQRGFNDDKPDSKNRIHNYNFIVFVEDCLKSPHNFKIHLNTYKNNQKSYQKKERH